MMGFPGWAANAIATGIRSGRLKAEAVVIACLERIAQSDPALNCFTTITRDRAVATARSIDAAIAAGLDPGPLAGVPYAVKNLFDIAGHPTVAGSRIGGDRPPASTDASLIRRLNGAGAVLVGALNMDEYAYGFTTENTHFGPTRNPHDLSRVAGGSSGGSAAAVAAGFVPLSLGSDTNGSIRVPAAFCGVFGLKPTFGRLSRAGAFSFVDSLDHTGLFARNTADLASAYDVLQGLDPTDRTQAIREPDPTFPYLEGSIEGLRIGALDGWFRNHASTEVLAAIDRISDYLRATPVTMVGAEVARAAAFCITAAEGASRHLNELRNRPLDFAATTRNRLLAGALIPAAHLNQAQRFRSWFRSSVAELFRSYDVLITPSAPSVAPEIDEGIRDDAELKIVRANIGIFTQPISFIGLPALSVPLNRPGMLPIGVQIITAPWAERLALTVAATLEAAGLVQSECPSRIQEPLWGASSKLG
jgi:AtzE family amidohydrolase